MSALTPTILARSTQAQSEKPVERVTLTLQAKFRPFELKFQWTEFLLRSLYLESESPDLNMEPSILFLTIVVIQQEYATLPPLVSSSEKRLGVKRVGRVASFLCIQTIRAQHTDRIQPAFRTEPGLLCILFSSLERPLLFLQHDYRLSLNIRHFGERR